MDIDAGVDRDKNMNNDNGANMGTEYNGERSSGDDKAAYGIAMSSRIRLARNYRDYPFPARLSADAARKILEMTKETFFSSKEINTNDYLYVDMQELDPIERIMLVEKHLASPELASGNKPCAAIISKDESVSIMLNEEDHLRIQCITGSTAIDEALEKCSTMERILESKHDIAYDMNLGYLTSCPTNLGTGMRASFMLHLPALVAAGQINGILEQCGRIGVAIRGIYGEFSAPSGNMFQFSNHGSLGNNESEIVNNIKNVGTQIIEHEHRLRLGVLEQSKTKFEDRVCRSLGVLTSARILDTGEFMTLWSSVRLGVDMGVIEDVDIKTLDELMAQSQSASLQKMAGRTLTPEERDVQRANLVRKRLAR